jgi:hypothetical protein
MGPCDLLVVGMAVNELPRLSVFRVGSVDALFWRLVPLW